MHLFHVSPYVYSPGQGQTIHWGRNFDDNRKAFSLCPYVASFKMISSKSDFIHIFNHFISWGQTFDVNRKPLTLQPLVESFKQISLNSDFIHIFNVFPHVYISGQGQTTLCGKNPDVNRKALSLCPFVASFKNIFEV